MNIQTLTDPAAYVAAAIERARAELREAKISDRVCERYRAEYWGDTNIPVYDVAGLKEPTMRWHRELCKLVASGKRLLQLHAAGESWRAETDEQLAMRAQFEELDDLCFYVPAAADQAAARVAAAREVAAKLPEAVQAALPSAVAAALPAAVVAALPKAMAKREQSLQSERGRLRYKTSPPASAFLDPFLKDVARRFGDNTPALEHIAKTYACTTTVVIEGVTSGDLLVTVHKKRGRRGGKFFRFVLDRGVGKPHRAELTPKTIKNRLGKFRAAKFEIDGKKRAELRAAKSR